MSTKRRAAPADEVRKDDAGKDAADDTKTNSEPVQTAKGEDEGSFLDILGIGDQPDEGGAADDQGGDDGGEGGGDPEPVQKAKAKDALGKLTPILQKLTGAVTKAKDLGDKPLTPEIAKAIGEVVEALKAFGGKADDADGGDDDADKKEKADAGALAAAVSKLTAIVDAVKKAGDGEAPKDLATKLAGIAKGLEGFLGKQKAPEDKKKDADADKKDADKKGKDAKGKTEKALELFKAAGSADDDDPEVIIKAGAKMKRSRLSKLKKAVETLAELISELEGEASGGKEKATKAVDLTPVMDRIDEFASAVKSRFEALEEKTDTVNKRVENIENTRPAGNGEADPDPVQKSDGEDNFWAGVL